MPENPRADELLRAARQTFLEHVLPAVPAEHKYEGLMIANAMAIGAREMGAGDLVLARQLQRLESLYEQEPPAIAGASAAERLELVEGKLVGDIRSGRFDSTLGGSLRNALLGLTRTRLGLSNPKYVLGWDAALAPGQEASTE